MFGRLSERYLLLLEAAFESQAGLTVEICGGRSTLRSLTDNCLLFEGLIYFEIRLTLIGNYS